MAVFLERAILCGLLLAIVFTALALGAVESWSIGIFQLIIVVLLMLWAIKMFIDRCILIHFPLLGLPLLALLVLGTIQSVAFRSGVGQRPGLSLDIEATRGTVTVLFFLLISFIIAANFFARHDRLRTMANFLAIYGLGLAMFAFIQYFTWNGKFYWIRPNVSSASPFGPFVNHNHFAGYMEMLIAVPAALAATQAARPHSRLFYGFSAAMMGLALVTSLSRGGMIALTAEMIFLALWSGKVRRKDAVYGPGRESGRHSFLRKVGAAGAISLVIIAGILWIGPDQIIGRIAHSGEAGESFSTSRGWIWKDTLSMIAANPVSGVGLGAYQTAYPKYDRSDGALLVNYAHNDYLQILADGGMIGGLIAVVFLILLVRAFRRGLEAPKPLVRAVALGSGTGIFALLVHSVMDFNLQIPSNALLFLFLTAVLASAAALAKKAKQQLPMNQHPESYPGPGNHPKPVVWL